MCEKETEEMKEKGEKRERAFFRHERRFWYRKEARTVCVYRQAT